MSCAGVSRSVSRREPRSRLRTGGPPRGPHRLLSFLPPHSKDKVPYMQYGFARRTYRWTHITVVHAHSRSGSPGPPSRTIPIPHQQPMFPTSQDTRYFQPPMPGPRPCRIPGPDACRRHTCHFPMGRNPGFRPPPQTKNPNMPLPCSSPCHYDIVSHFSASMPGCGHVLLPRIAVTSRKVGSECGGIVGRRKAEMGRWRLLRPLYPVRTSGSLELFIRYVLRYLYVPWPPFSPAFCSSSVFTSQARMQRTLHGKQPLPFSPFPRRLSRYHLEVGWDTSCRVHPGHILSASNPFRSVVHARGPSLDDVQMVVRRWGKMAPSGSTGLLTALAEKCLRTRGRVVLVYKWIPGHRGVVLGGLWGCGVLVFSASPIQTTEAGTRLKDASTVDRRQRGEETAPRQTDPPPTLMPECGRITRV